MRAELHADDGASAAAEEFFRSPAFLVAEGATHTLQVGQALIPVRVRDIPSDDTLHDAISPYGYPGATLPAGAEPPDPREVDWSATGLVSLFVRDRVGEPAALKGGTERSPLLFHDPARERRVRPRLAEQVRRNEREGWAVKERSGPESQPEARAAFHALYTETMERTGAAPRYLFEPDYFEAILGHPGTSLLMAEREAGTPGAGAIVVLSDGVLHYYLGGTADAALDDSPFKNVVVAMMDLSDRLDVPLNLGGGVTEGDGLERFKRGFANSERPFVTHEVVCDAEVYERLSGEGEPDAFFPAYRAP